MTVGEDDMPQLYQPLAQITNDRRRLQFVPSIADVTRVAGGGRAKHAASARTVGRHQVEPLYSSIGLAFLPSQVGAMLFGAIGLLTLVLAAIGLYGMMAYWVARQTQEIGIRMAIGATRSDISRMVLREAVTLVAAGSVIGVGIALFVMRPLAMFLVASLTPADPLSLGGVVVVLTLTALAASSGPGLSCRSRRSCDDAEVRLTLHFRLCARLPGYSVHAASHGPRLHNSACLFSARRRCEGGFAATQSEI